MAIDFPSHADQIDPNASGLTRVSAAIVSSVSGGSWANVALWAWPVPAPHSLARPFIAPAKIPRPILAKLNAEITRILELPDVRARWQSLGTEPIPSTPQAFDKLVIDEIAALTKLARVANVQPN